MGLQKGGGKVFPVQLMTVRRSKNGQVRSTFLTGDSSDYCLSVIEVFSRSIGKSRSDIEKELRIVELKSQNPKILRGLALLMFRLSVMERPSVLDPAVVRDCIFNRAKEPALTHEERDKVLSAVADDLHSTVSEVNNAIYADNEDNEILTRVADVDPERLSRKYNIEQIETVMLKSQWVEIRTTTNRNRFVRKIRSLGLLYSEKSEAEIHILRVSGPVSILEHSERYGSRFSLLVRYILRFQDWEIEASVKLKNGKDKDEFLYHLDHSVSEFTGVESSPDKILPDFVKQEPGPVQNGDSYAYPDCNLIVKDNIFNIFITTPKYYLEDLNEIGNLIKSDIHVRLVCVVSKNEKCPKGAICFKEEVDWYALRDRLTEVEKFTGSRNENNLPSISDTAEMTKKLQVNAEVVAHLKELYPDSQAMVDYLDFMGLPPAELLEQAGFSITWKGLRLIVKDFHGD